MIALDALLAFHNSSMTDFQLDRFVTVRSGGTPYGCFFQALRELHKRLRGVRAGYLQRQRLAVKIARADSVAMGNDHKAALAEIRAVELRNEAEYCEKHIATDEHEFLRFYSQAAGLFVHLGFDREPPTPERIAQLDRERFEHNALCQIAENHINGLPPGNVIGMIQSMPTESRNRVLSIAFGEGTNHQQRIENLNHLANWYLNYEPDLPDPLALSEAESRRLLSCCESAPLPMLLANSSPMAAISSPGSSYRSASEPANRASGVPA